MTLANKEMLNNRYEIIKPIGSGGMAEVYLAKDTLLDREVAIKMLRSQFNNDKALLDQFKREAKSAAKLVHPNIINVYDVVAGADEQFIVMEYVDGINLKHYMEQNKLKIIDVLDIVIKISEGLQHAHNHKIVHCDIKPLNILLDKNLNPKIADFGIAKMVSNQTLVYTNSIMGSVHYISPEQAGGEKVSYLSDVYSLGVVLFEMLTGRVPFNGPTAVSVAMMHTEKEVPPLAEFMENVPDGLQEILDKALAKRPENRYQSAAQFRRELLNLRMRLDPDASYEVGEHLKTVGAMNATTMSLPNHTAGSKERDERVDTVVMQPVRSPKNDDLADTLILPRGKAVGAVESGSKLENEVKNVLDALDRRKKEEAKEMAVKRKINYTRLLLLITGIVVVISVIAHFIFSGPKAIVVVPDVVNKTTAEAKKDLDKLNFKIQIDEKFGDIEKFKPGVVMEQSVKPGEKRKEGSLIILTVSKGAEQKGVPDLKGMSLVKATTTLENLGFKLGKVERKYNKEEKLGGVLEQSPKAAEQLGKGSAVDIVINEGNIEIPQIVGKSQEEATKLIVGAKLVLGDVRVVTDNNVKKGYVITCNPDAGVRLGEGDKVDITISDGGVSNSVYVDFAIPGTKMCNVVITVEDNAGKTTILSGMKKGGIRIRQKVDIHGKAKATLVVDGRVVEERSL